jgi:hypothetical protein
MEREIELHCPECREQQWQMLSDIELDAGPFFKDCEKCMAQFAYAITITIAAQVFRLVPAVAIATTNGSAT